MRCAACCHLDHHSTSCRILVGTGHSCWSRAWHELAIHCEQCNLLSMGKRSPEQEVVMLSRNASGSAWRQPICGIRCLLLHSSALHRNTPRASLLEQTSSSARRRPLLLRRCAKWRQSTRCSTPTHVPCRLLSAETPYTYLEHYLLGSFSRNGSSVSCVLCQGALCEN